MTVRTASTDGSETANLLAIASDNSWLHVYSNVRTMLSEDDIGINNKVGGMEFFDNEGRRLAPIFSHTWDLVDLTPAEDKADPEYVHARVCSVVEHLKRHLARRREEETSRLKQYGLTPDQAAMALPDLTDLSLAQSLRAFVPGPDDEPFEHDGSWMHNLLHRSGWTHD